MTTFDLAIKVTSDNNSKIIAASFDSVISYKDFLDNLYLKEIESLDKTTLLLTELTVKVPVDYTVDQLKTLGNLITNFTLDTTSVATIKLPENSLNSLVKLEVVQGVAKLVPPTDAEVMEYLFRLVR